MLLIFHVCLACGKDDLWQFYYFMNSLLIFIQSTRNLNRSKEVAKGRSWGIIALTQVIGLFLFLIQIKTTSHDYQYNTIDPPGSLAFKLKWEFKTLALLCFQVANRDMGSLPLRSPPLQQAHTTRQWILFIGPLDKVKQSMQKKLGFIVPDGMTHHLSHSQPLLRAAT